MKFCLLFNLSLCARYYLLIGSQLTTWSQGNLHYIGLHFFQLDREFFCLLPSLARLYSAAASPSERLRSDGSLAIILFYSIFDLKDILLSLAFDELSWDYTPAPAMEPGCLDTFWLEFDTPGYDGQSLEVQRLQVFSKQVSLALFSWKFEEHWYILRRRTLHTAMDLKLTSMFCFFLISRLK